MNLELFFTSKSDTFSQILREQYGVKCMLGLTATATMVTAASVAQHLGIDDYQTATIRDMPVPSNLQLSVSRDTDKDQVGVLDWRGRRGEGVVHVQ